MSLLGSTQTRVNSTEQNNQNGSSVTALTGGGWVVSWVSYNPTLDSSDLKVNFCMDSRK